MLVRRGGQVEVIPAIEPAACECALCSRDILAKQAWQRRYHPDKVCAGLVGDPELACRTQASSSLNSLKTCVEHLSGTQKLDVTDGKVKPLYPIWPNSKQCTQCKEQKVEKQEEEEQGGILPTFAQTVAPKKTTPEPTTFPAPEVDKKKQRPARPTAPRARFQLPFVGVTLAAPNVLSPSSSSPTLSSAPVITENKCNIYDRAVTDSRNRWLDCRAASLFVADKKALQKQIETKYALADGTLPLVAKTAPPQMEWVARATALAAFYQTSLAASKANPNSIRFENAPAVIGCSAERTAWQNSLSALPLACIPIRPVFGGGYYYRRVKRF